MHCNGMRVTVFHFPHPGGTLDSITRTNQFSNSNSGLLRKVVGSFTRAAAINNRSISLLSAKLVDARLYTPHTNRKEIEQQQVFSVVSERDLSSRVHCRQALGYEVETVKHAEESKQVQRKNGLRGEIGEEKNYPLDRRVE